MYRYILVLNSFSKIRVKNMTKLKHNFRQLFFVEVEGKIVMLAGGAGGLGEALAGLVLSRGGLVWICDRYRPYVEDHGKDIEEMNYRMTRGCR